jgi:hypothetical protein
VDTVIAAIGLLSAQQALGLDTSGTEALLRGIEWGDLVMPGGISHGYTCDDALIPYAWDVYGGESWLVELAYAAATGRIAPLTYPSQPTANGSGFIDELAFLFAPPPSGKDVWGNDWQAYRSAAADAQMAYFGARYPTSCFVRVGLWGLSASEGPDPARVPPGNIYQAFGIGGRFAAPNDGSALWGAPVVTPHYSALIASLRPEEATRVWDWLIGHGYFSPLTNVESLLFQAGTSCDPPVVTWNSLKGSWNLALQALGWGRYLAERRGQVPILWRATMENALLQQGYRLLAPGGSAAAPTTRPISTILT